MTEKLLEAWRTNHRINLLMIEKITEEGMRCSLSTRGGRDVARQFGHMHDNRVWHLEKRAPDLAEGLETFPSKSSPSKKALIAAHEASTERVATFLADLLRDPATLKESGLKRKGFRKGVFTTLSYFVAHESHHRGSIVLTLKQSGHPLEKAARYGIWDWDRR